jgi:hypothetical protein
MTEHAQSKLVDVVLNSVEDRACRGLVSGGGGTDKFGQVSRWMFAIHGGLETRRERFVT